MNQTSSESSSDLPPDWEDLAERAEPESSGSEDELVCPNCLTPIAPHSHLCSNCGGPVSDRAFCDPFARIWGEGHIYHRVTRFGYQPSLSILIGIWLIFIPGIVSMGLGLIMSGYYVLSDFTKVGALGGTEDFGLSASLFGALLMTFIMGLQIAIVRRVTLNYLRAKAASDGED